MCQACDLEDGERAPMPASGLCHLAARIYEDWIQCARCGDLIEPSLIVRGDRWQNRKANLCRRCHEGQRCRQWMEANQNRRRKNTKPPSVDPDGRDGHVDRREGEIEQVSQESALWPWLDMDCGGEE